ncbi:DUF6765 family protein [Halanaerobium sp.]|uniref:DUF6765 family protein n=1 Tax=Halanaerobium sp. TaxID=1895664 RepID=UPI000DE73803|nr:DUF6765 family protein [Halanaerobium sp.]PUU87215.1 MAG: hypothetical protein CI949_3693 [Halanaerobium sp.]
MQKDFHFCAVYVLCRLAGMESTYAEKTAYASQQVDDAVYNHALKFENGDVFHQTQTAHKELSFLESSDVNNSFNIWLPFHFLPAGIDNEDPYLTETESKTVQLLKEKVTAAGSKAYGIHQLGIFLHLYADTYSHQGFKGFYDKSNFVKLTQGVEKLKIKDKCLKFAIINLPDLFPIGHLLVIKNPDIPYAEWEYYKSGVFYQVNNLEDRFMPAVENIFAFIRDFLAENTQYGTPAGGDALKSRISKIRNTLAEQAFLEGRYHNWLDKIHNNFFDFKDFDQQDRTLNYDDRAWFKKAVKAVKVSKYSFEGLKSRAYNYHRFYKKDGFEHSDWTLYMQAAAEHKYRVLHQVLAEAGLTIA